MGRSKASRPRRLAEKLRDLRSSMELSQFQMYERLKEDGMTLHPGYIGSYETGEKVPSLLVVLKYSRVAGIAMEALVDDDLELPGKLRKRNT